MRDFKRWVECLSFPCDRLETLLFHLALIENLSVQFVLILNTTMCVLTLEWGI